MTTTRHIAVKDLPETLRAAHDSMGCYERDVSVTTADTFSAFSAGGDGMRAIVVLLDMETGKAEHFSGSWGGANPWSPGNAIDRDQREQPIPVNGAVLRGYQGGRANRRGVWGVSIVVRPDAIAALLPAPDGAPPLDPATHGVLDCFPRLKAFARREEAAHYFGVHGADYDAALEVLAARGLVKINKAGAASITTDGKNYLASHGTPKPTQVRRVY